MQTSEAGLRVTEKTVGILGSGENVTLTAGEQDSRLLLIAGQRLNEPVARGGPFVMNSRSEVLQAFQDYQNGKF